MVPFGLCLGSSISLRSMKMVEYTYSSTMQVIHGEHPIGFNKSSYLNESIPISINSDMNQLIMMFLNITVKMQGIEWTGAVTRKETIFGENVDWETTCQPYIQTQNSSYHMFFSHREHYFWIRESCNAATTEPHAYWIESEQSSTKCHESYWRGSHYPVSFLF